jgi:hypothetical protein
MNIGRPNHSGVPANQGVVQNNPAASVQAKASAPTGEALEVRAAQPGIVASLREAASRLEAVRPEMVRKGSAFLADPHYPPLNSINSIASIIIDDFFLNKKEPGQL